MGSKFAQRCVEFSTRVTLRLGKQSFISCLFVIAMTNSVVGQESGSVLTGASGPYLRQWGIRFERNVNTFLWDGRIDLAENLGSTVLRLSEHYQSRLIRTDRNFIKDEQRLNVVLVRRLSDRIRARFHVNSFLLSDNQTIGINEASNHTLLGGVRYEPHPGLRIDPMIGVRLDNQSGERDGGISYQVAAETDRFDISGYRMKFFGKFSQYQILPRRAENDTLALHVDKVFFGETRNGIQARFTRLRRDFYFPIDTSLGQSLDLRNNIESRTENIFTVVDTLKYEVSRKFGIGIRGRIFNRSVEKQIRYKSTSSPANLLFDSEIEDFRLEGEVQLTYRLGKRLFSRVRFGVNERDERHTLVPLAGVDQTIAADRSRQERRKDNTARRTNVTGNLAWSVSRSDIVLLSGSTALLRYDTPSEINVDDRDELLFVFNATTLHTLSPYLKLRISGTVNLNHVVYVFAARSADNNWNRVWKLSPRIEYKPSDQFSSVNAFEVLANYTVYDFEDQVFSVRSFSFRQFAFIDSSLYRFSDRLGAFFAAHVKLYERGELKWKEFKERPVNYFEDKTFAFQLRYMAGAQMNFSAGIRYFSQSRFVYRGRDRDLDHTVKSYGPTSTIVWAVGTRTRFSLSGWYEIQEQTGLPNRSISNVAMNLSVRL